MVDYILNLYKALGSIPSTITEKKNKKKKKMELPSLGLQFPIMS
jgi:hypothetical protein